MTTPRKIEVRMLPAKGLEIRTEGEEAAKKKKIMGYAAVWNSESVDLGFFTETILPGAFQESLSNGADVAALIDHVPTLILGRRKAGTLKLKEDNVGLHIEVDPLPDTQLVRDLLVNLEMGNIDQMSFAMYVTEDRWSIRNGKDHREIVKAEIYDVSVVTFPAYPATTVSAEDRDLGQAGIEQRANQLGPEVRSVAHVYDEYLVEKKSDGFPTGVFLERKQRLLEMESES